MKDQQKKKKKSANKASQNKVFGDTQIVNCLNLYGHGVEKSADKASKNKAFEDTMIVSA